MKITKILINLIFGRNIKEPATEFQIKKEIFNISDLKRSIDIIVKLASEGKKGLEEKLTLESSKTHIRNIDTLSLIDEIFNIANKYDTAALLFTPHSIHIVENGLTLYYQQKLKQYNLIDKDAEFFWATFCEANMLAEIKRCIDKGKNYAIVTYDILNYCYKNQIFSKTDEFDNLIPLILEKEIIELINMLIKTDNLGLIKKIFSNNQDLEEVKNKYWNGNVVEYIKKYSTGSQLLKAIKHGNDEMFLYLYSNLGFINDNFFFDNINEIIEHIIKNNNYQLLTKLFQEMIKNANKDEQSLEITQLEFDAFLRCVSSHLSNNITTVDRKMLGESMIYSIRNTQYKDNQVEKYFNSIIPIIIKISEKKLKREDEIANLVKILGSIRNDALVQLAKDNTVEKALAIGTKK